MFCILFIIKLSIYQIASEGGLNVSGSEIALDRSRIRARLCLKNIVKVSPLSGSVWLILVW